MDSNSIENWFRIHEKVDASLHVIQVSLDYSRNKSSPMQKANIYLYTLFYRGGADVPDLTYAGTCYFK